MHSSDSLNLKKRYLIWLYKTTKESLDKIERKFTQVAIDKLLVKGLRRLDKNRIVAKLIDDFVLYSENKEKDGLSLKYSGKAFKSQYTFLVFKLKSIENVIVKEFGKAGLKEIKSLYEKEMIGRILRSAGSK